MKKVVVYNYTGNEVEYTRVTEYKYLTAQKSESTTISYEFSEKDGEPFYPVPTLENKNRYNGYKRESEKTKSIIFCGRLAEYQYYNMDQVVANSLNSLKSI